MSSYLYIYKSVCIICTNLFVYNCIHVYLCIVIVCIILPVLYIILPTYDIYKHSVYSLHLCIYICNIYEYMYVYRSICLYLHI